MDYIIAHYKFHYFAAKQFDIHALLLQMHNRTTQKRWGERLEFMYNIIQITQNNFQNGEKVKKSFLALGIAIVLSPWSFGEEQQMQTKELPAEQMQKQNREIVKLASEEISKTLPQKVDDYTTLMTVEGKDTTLIYTFEINTGAKSDDAVKKEDRGRMQKAVTAGICQSSKRFLDAKVNISYLYIGARSKAELFRFDVTQAECPRGDRQ